MQFLSDNAAAVHPAVWTAMQAADEADAPYDHDSLSRTLDAAFADLFGRDCAALWVASGTAANCLALATLVEPHGGVLCHEEAHIEMDEGGAPGFFLHGAKLMPLPGARGKITPEAIAARRAQVREGVHQVHPHAISITQASEVGCVYRPEEVAAIASAAQAGPGRRLGLHMDGARFANAVAFLGGAPGACLAGVDALSFGFIKNGAMSAEAIVLFDPAAADLARFRRKRAGHLQSKGRFLAAQILAMLKGDLWLANARAANAAAAELGAAAKDRLLHPVEANEVFIACTHDERQALRGAGFAFYDWGDGAARMVTAWDARAQHVAALARALAAL
ncbi:beta-eliminating lyase-related protein [Novosphingobium sp. 1949]|uniref:Beta-eliminating lyase-related protein n=1 Tax=Novosphingobium organovorum TaxID=2930092 RepID=A0ABT0B8X3_9SPHN|nr:beta-eliminating lyase-related protein [Novosphingobium organovorum]MCJ2181507.1 beta-eliminating lyase-related protein [Novosphingobium organovorum]